MKRDLYISYSKIFSNGTTGCEEAVGRWEVDDSDRHSLSSVVNDVERICEEDCCEAIIFDNDLEGEDAVMAVYTCSRNGGGGWSIDDDSIFAGIN